MKVEIQVDETLAEPKVVIYTGRVTPEITDLANRLSGDTTHLLTAFQGERVFLLNPDDVLTICTEGQRVFAHSDKGTYRLKSRLYELEDQLAGSSFVRISNSEIVNFNKVESLDLSISGTITLRLKNGAKSYVSRRYMEKIKTYLGL